MLESPHEAFSHCTTRIFLPIASSGRLTETNQNKAEVDPRETIQNADKSLGPDHHDLVGNHLTGGDDSVHLWKASNRPIHPEIKVR